jgi:hypothetical protein
MEGRLIVSDKVAGDYQLLPQQRRVKQDRRGEGQVALRCWQAHQVLGSLRRELSARF